MNAPICAWSNRPDPGTRPVQIASGRPLEKPRVYDVCPEHESILRRHAAALERRRPFFFAALAAIFISALVPLFTDSTLGLALPLFTMGVTLIAFPYAAPLTVSRNGIRGSVRLLRAFGCVLLVFAVTFAALAFV